MISACFVRTSFSASKGLLLENMNILLRYDTQPLRKQTIHNIAAGAQTDNSFDYRFQVNLLRSDLVKVDSTKAVRW
jgi:hypothetical protein